MKEFLTKKYGPLPVWGWGVVVVAGVVFFLRYRASQPTATAGSTTTASVPFATTGGSANGTGTTAAGAANGYSGSLSDQIGTLTEDISALQGLNTVLGLGSTGSGTPTASAGGPGPTQTTGTNQFLGLDGVLYDASGFWWVNGIPYPKWQFSAPPAPGSAGSVGFAVPPAGWPFSPVPGQSALPASSAGGLLSGGNPAPLQPAGGTVGGRIPAATAPPSLGFPGIAGNVPTGYPHGGGGG